MSKMCASTSVAYAIIKLHTQIMWEEENEHFHESFDFMRATCSQWHNKHGEVCDQFYVVNEVVCNISYGDRGSWTEIVNFQVGINCTHDINFPFSKLHVPSTCDTNDMTKY